MLAILFLASLSFKLDQKDLQANRQILQKYKNQFQTGFVSAGDSFHYFYHFVKADENWETAPLLFWSNGGPLCSSTYGLFIEIGPLILRNNSTRLQLNPHSWTKKFNILVLDYPAQIGFSYSDANKLISEDQSSCRAIAAAIQSFYKLKPQLKRNPLYLAGQSYAGYIVVILSNILLDQKVRFDGVIMVSACIDPEDCFPSYSSSVPTLYKMHLAGLIDETHFKTLLSKCFPSASRYDNKDCTRELRQLTEVANKVGVRAESDLTFYCPKQFQDYQFCTQIILERILNDASIKNILGYPANHQWQICQNLPVRYTVSNGVYPRLKFLVANVPILFLTGALDSSVASIGGFRALSRLKEELALPAMVSWRKWYSGQAPDYRITLNGTAVLESKVGEEFEVAGMFWQIQNVTLMTFVQSGHEIPKFRPKESLEAVTAFAGLAQFNYELY